MPRNEYEPSHEQGSKISRFLRRQLGRIGLFLNPTPEELELKMRASVTKRWTKHGRPGFMIVPSAESAPSTPEYARRFYPADSLPNSND